MTLLNRPLISTSARSKRGEEGKWEEERVRRGKERKRDEERKKQRRGRKGKRGEGEAKLYTVY